ncbi:glycoside hydrolase family 97 catalytic domain-containing protein [Halobaculum gomorrense]|uniref:Glycosyl-hydrolase 97 C-terminal, oligomerisation n=1 Tax=Halobaculum gomorrense TaxID=43928 RepID=A0A1M5UNF9_9EURY|nr:glycoside hydrolase family 97 catalytic domain-containing protein [Halobaculum gomorrense]SHH64461.1 Glycosyl-hydrolase 97 C-terminal, oligomerisation [Halobaculum gomorrense]
MSEKESQTSFNEIKRRGFLGGVASLLSAAAYTQQIPKAAAKPVTTGSKSDTQHVTSPDGRITVTVDSSDGMPAYSVAVDGTTYIDTSTLGFDFQNQATFGAGADSSADVTVTGSETAQATETWEPVWDQYERVAEQYTTLRLGLEETTDPGRSGNLEIRVFDDGLGFRFILDESFTANGDKAVIRSENTQINFAGDYTCWWIRNAFTNPRFEQEYTESRLSDVAAGTRSIRPTGTEIRTGAHTPLTIEANDETYLSVHQASLEDYALASLAPTADGGGTRFETQLAPLPDNTKVSWELPNATPWRTVQVGTSPEDLRESSLIPLLNEELDTDALPSKNGQPDTDWLTPRKYVGIWWTMIAGNAHWEYRDDAGPSYIHGARTERMKRYMHFAAHNGIESVLAEGWNQGWDTYPGDGTGFEMGVNDSYPDFDVPEVTDYGADRSAPVEMTIHNETAGNIVNYEDEVFENDIFEGYEAEGIRSIKNGYVSDPGLSFEGTGAQATHTQHCQLAVKHNRRVIAEAAGERQWLEIHEGIVPTGERRTYPNVGAREVVKAQEYDGFGALASNVGRDHHVTLPYTRMLAGPTSFQPGIFDLEFTEDTGGKVQTTLAKQLAMYPSYNAGLQMAADRVEAYVDETFEVGEYVQAASGDLTGGIITADNWRNAFGTNYVPLDPNREPSGASASFTVRDFDGAGTYTLHFRYASAPDENAGRVIDNGSPEFTLSVNGTTQSVSPSFTTGWDEWGVYSLDVDLQAGDNTLAFILEYDDSGTTFAGDVGGLNLNTVGVTEQGDPAPFPAAYTDLTEAHIANENVETKTGFEFIEAIPAGGWDDSVAVDGDIGEYSVTARKHGDEWYVGAMSDGNGRAIEIPLEFLSPRDENGRGKGTPQGPKFVAEIYSDGIGGGVDADQTALRKDVAIVDPSTAVLASMTRSGGTAVRLRPARGTEINDLPEYTLPEQDLSFDISADAALDEPFITATGSNSGDYIGGRTVDLRVDGDIVATENVRLPPNSSDATFTFGFTIASRGTYSVELLDHDDGAVLAAQTVDINPGELIAEFTDPSGDDAGPGGYTYPTDGAFQDGAFDLRRFAVYESETAYLFSFEVANLYDAFGGAFSPHFFVVYLSDTSIDGGRRTQLDDLNPTVEFDSAWDYRVSASGFSTTVVDDQGTDLGTPERLVDLNGNTAILSVPKETLDDLDPQSVSVAPIVGSEDFGSFRDVAVDRSAFTFGGADPAAVENAPSVIDLLTPEGITQAEALAYSTERLATIPFTSL